MFITSIDFAVKFDHCIRYVVELLCLSYLNSSSVDCNNKATYKWQGTTLNCESVGVRGFEFKTSATIMLDDQHSQNLKVLRKAFSGSYIYSKFFESVFALTEYDAKYIPFLAFDPF